MTQHLFRFAEAYAALKVREHGKHVGQFLNDMYATMIDPCAEGQTKVAEMCDQLLKAAHDNRQALYDAHSEIASLRRELGR